MRKKIFLILATVLLSVSTNAQYDQKLYNKLTTAFYKSKSDTARIRIMLALGDYHVEQSYMQGYQKSMDTAYNYAKKCEQLSKAVKSNSYLADTYLLYSKACNYESKYDQSIVYADKAISLFKKEIDIKGILRGKRSVFAAYKYVPEKFDQVYPLSEQNIALALKTGDNLLTAKAYEDHALGNRFTDNTQGAITALNKALKYYKAAGEERTQSVYSTLGLCYDHNGEEDKALKSTLTAIAIAEKFNDQSFYMGDLYDLAGGTYFNMENYTEALKYYKKAYKIASRYIDFQGQVFILLSIKDVLILTKQYKEAKVYFTKIEDNFGKVEPYMRRRVIASMLKSALDLKDDKNIEKYHTLLLPLMPSIETTGDKMEAYTCMVSYYFYKKNYADSRTSLYEFGRTMEKFGNKNNREYYYRMLFRIDSAQGKYISAMSNYQIANKIRDSLFNEKKSKQLTELQVQYEVEKKDKDNLLLKQKAELQDNKLSKASTIQKLGIGSILLLIIIILLIFRQYNLNQKRRIETHNKNLTLQSLLKEKEWLLKEIHHRVKNNLQIVMSLLNSQSYHLKDAAAVAAIRDSQHRLHSMSLIHQKLYLADTMSTINMKAYIDELVDYLRSSFEKPNINFVVDSGDIELDVSHAVPVGLILNEAITNAIKHAFPEGRKGIISVILRKNEAEIIELIISDNGIGIKDTGSKNANSLGMILMQGFSKDLNGKFVLTASQGTVIKVTFPRYFSEHAKDYSKIS